MSDLGTLKVILRNNCLTQMGVRDQGENGERGVYWSTSPMIGSYLIWFLNKTSSCLMENQAWDPQVGKWLYLPGGSEGLDITCLPFSALPRCEEYSSEVMRVNFLYGLMGREVSISTTGHSMERRFIILIPKTFDIKYSKLADTPLPFTHKHSV